MHWDGGVKRRAWGIPLPSKVFYFIFMLFFCKSKDIVVTVHDEVKSNQPLFELSCCIVSYCLKISNNNIHLYPSPFNHSLHKRNLLMGEG